VCFYSLSNFIMSAPPAKPERYETFANRYGVALDPDYPHLPYGVDAKRSLIAKLVLSQRGVERASFLPVLIDRKLRPEVLKPSDARFDDGVLRQLDESGGPLPIDATAAQGTMQGNPRQLRQGKLLRVDDEVVASVDARPGQPPPGQNGA
jgi:hypothetical protein